ACLPPQCFFTFHANTAYNPDIRSFCHYTAIIPRQIPLHHTHMNRPLIPQIVQQVRPSLPQHLPQQIDKS
ncbi:unnamed protein product, partial [Musa hybrid cultivar]